MLKLTKGEGVQCGKDLVVNEQTSRTKPFTEATLLDAMNGVARFVEGPRIRKVLRDPDGLGTSAALLQTLFKSGYLEKARKRVTSTALGRVLIDALPVSVTLPDMTTLWGHNLSMIAPGDEILGNFMANYCRRKRLDHILLC